MAKGKPTTHRCVTDSLSDPHLGGILLGLEIKDGLVIPDEKVFPCCQGAGSYFDPASQSVKTCKIKTRIRRVQELLDQYSLAWHGKKTVSPFKMSSRASLDILVSLEAMINAPNARASMITGEKDKAGSIWAHALALAYRFDLDVKLLHFKRDCSSALWTGTPPQVVLIEHVDKLWDPDLALEFDGIITYVYEAAVPCIIEFISPGPISTADSKPAEQATVKSQFARKIEQLKQRSPMTYVPAASLSKLKEMTGGR